MRSAWLAEMTTQALRVILNDSSLEVNSGQFGFNLYGGADWVVVVERAADLARCRVKAPVILWEPEPGGLRCVSSAWTCPGRGSRRESHRHSERSCGRSSPAFSFCVGAGPPGYSRIGRRPRLGDWLTRIWGGPTLAAL